MQAVADTRLEQIEADFRAAGTEPVPCEEIAGNELFRKFSAKYYKDISVGASAGDSQFQFIGKKGLGIRLWLKQSIPPQQNPFTLGAADALRPKDQMFLARLTSRL